MILVTGGAGYIGSHTVLSLLENGHEVIVLDNLSNGNYEAIKRVEQITRKNVVYYKGDVLDKNILQEVFTSHSISAVIHFAALKAVGESTQRPLDYYHNNVSGTVNLLEMMRDFEVNNFIFSSSATVYGIEADTPYLESMPLGTTTSPYGASKVMVEQIMRDLATADGDFSAISLRYFNPIGAHESGLIGEDPNGIPNNLLPFIAQVAVGKRNELSIFGDDYSTGDGTCERDYLHVMDLAEGHVAAVNWLTINPEFSGVEVFNLGTGQAYSVYQILRTFEQACESDIPYKICPRRQGDLPAFWADASKANRLLNWRTKRTIQQMMQDTWRWQSNNPDGYQ